MNEQKPAKPWEVPVCVKTPGGMALLVRSPDEALHALSNVWPTIDGAQYKVAGRVCIAALCGRRTTEECRQAFLAACRESRILLAELPRIE